MNPTLNGAGSDPLTELRGLHLPAPVGLWPPAPGWWIAAGLAAAAVLIAVAVVRQRRRSVGLRALRELDAIARAKQGADVQSLAAELAELVRRVALVRFGAAIASLHGEPWESFLREHAPRAGRFRRRAFAPEVGHALAVAPYVPPGALGAAEGARALDRDALLAAARTWIRWNT